MDKLQDFLNLHDYSDIKYTQKREIKFPKQQPTATQILVEVFQQHVSQQPLRTISGCVPAVFRNEQLHCQCTTFWQNTQLKASNKSIFKKATKKRQQPKKAKNKQSRKNLKNAHFKKISIKSKKKLERKLIRKIVTAVLSVS